MLIIWIFMHLLFILIPSPQIVYAIVLFPKINPPNYVYNLFLGLCDYNIDIERLAIKTN